MGNLIDMKPDRQMRSAQLAPEYFSLAGPQRTVTYERLCRVRLVDGTITYRWLTVTGTAIDIGGADREASK